MRRHERDFCCAVRGFCCRDVAAARRAFATLTGINIGTQWTRAACGLLMTAPLGLLIGLWCVPMGLAIWAGLALTGWEEFQQMGTESVALLTEKPQYWMRWLPWSLGLRPGQVEYDLFGMAQAGMCAWHRWRC